MIRRAILTIVVALAFIPHSLSSTETTTKKVEEFFSSGHTNNWAVLVDTSRFWFNYRHVANVLSMYRSIKRLGIPDSHIILMSADDMACNPRNVKPGTVYNNAHQHINVYGDDVEVDYRGYEVTVENFIRVLTGRHENSVSRTKRLLSDDRSNVLVYMTGHGGDGFLKFQDAEEIVNKELADAFEQMWQKRRYHEILFIIDTCQAVSMYQEFYSPNIIAMGSSQVGEDSLSHHVDPNIGVYIIDRFTYYALEFLERVAPNSKSTLGEFFKCCPKRLCISTVGVREDLYPKNPKKVKVTEFFGGVRNVELTRKTVTLTTPTHKSAPENFTTPEDSKSTLEQDDGGEGHREPIFAYQKQFPTDLINHLKAQQKMRHF